MQNRPDFQLLARRAAFYHSDRLAMRQFSLSDLWPFWETTRNPSFNQGVLWPRPSQVEEIARRTDSLTVAAARGDIATVSAVVRTTGQWAALFRYLTLDGELELGLWSNPELWGAGMGTEVTRLAVFAAFLELGVESMCARVAIANVPAVRVLQKAGLTYVGEYPSKHESLGIVDRQLYRITREQFAELDPDSTAVAHNVTRFDPVTGTFEKLAHQSGLAT